MNIIRPTTLTQASITSNNLVDSVVLEYSSGDTYASGNEVIVSVDESGNSVFPIIQYESLIDANTGSYPPDNVLNWLEIGAINKHAMFDSVIGTQSEADGTELTDTGKIVFRIDTSKQDSIALFNVLATKVTIELFDSGSNLISTQTEDLQAYQVANFFEYFYNDFNYSHDLVYSFDRYLSSTVRVTIEHNVSGDYPMCGFVIVGSSFFIGDTEYGVSSGILDFSKKERNTFGNIYLKQGEYAKILDVDLVLDNDRYDIVQSVLTSIRGIPTLFQGNNDSTEYESFNVLGFYRDFDLVLRYHETSELSLRIEGLV